MPEGKRKILFKRWSSTWTRQPLKEMPTSSEDQSQTSHPRRRTTISAPFDIYHKISIRYNFNQARYEGIPAVWSRQQVNQQFGVPWTQIPRVNVPGYDDRIPAVLMMLSSLFLSLSGAHVLHIFRTSPCKDARDAAILSINEGTFQNCNDPVIAADLIKVWFRELPTPLLQCITPAQMELLIKDGEEKTRFHLHEWLHPSEHALLLWLLDLMITVAKHQDENQMGLEQLATVVAPNLFRCETKNPMVAVIFAKTTVKFLQVVLQYRRAETATLQKLFPETF